MRTEVENRNAFHPRSALEGRRSFFLVGIGGAGMLGLVDLLLDRGLRVRGSDAVLSPAVRELNSSGVEVTLGHSGDPLQADDALIVSDAVDLATSPEVARAQVLGVPVCRRSQALAWLLEGRRCLCVAGTHGKSTTAAMIAAGLEAAGLDPTVVVGASWRGAERGVRIGKGEWAVVEACEAYDSLRDFDPYVVALTNVELDHVDYYRDQAHLEEVVGAFVARIPRGGSLLYNAADAGARRVAERATQSAPAPDWDSAPPRLPGAHNRSNAALALAACVAVGADVECARAGITSFTGIGRRLEVVSDGEFGVAVVDDYAHHPSEIDAGVQALRERYPGRRLVLVFQPHLYSRTAPLVAEFARSLSLADLVVLTDIYPAREKPMPGVSSARIAESITCACRYVPSRHALPRAVADLAQPGDVVVGMGAGNIADFMPRFLDELRERARSAPLRVAVVMGGDSAEREVSLHSGRAVLDALVALGYDAFAWDPAETLQASGDASALVGPRRPHVAFLAVHGTRAEDGAVQGLLELLGIPYTGSGPAASALAMDKATAKRLLEAAGVRTPRGELVASPNAALSFEAPYVVKPNAQGSTVGLCFVERREDLPSAISRALDYDRQALVEEWLSGTELSVPLLGERVLPAVEIVPRGDRYDFEAKYTPGATEEIVPARIPPEIAERVAQVALVSHRALGCQGATRVDIMLVGDEPFVLEVNTLPGLTPTSLLPRSADAAGLSFGELCDWMVKDALARAGVRSD